MAEQQEFTFAQLCGEGGVARVARRSFQPGALVGFDLHTQDLARQIQLRAEASAVFGPQHAVRVQAVIDMQRAQTARARRAQLRQRMQQRAGIRAAAESDA